MASSESAESQIDLKCAVCLDYFVDPKAMPACPHTFCLECLKPVHAAGKSKKSIVCPTCRVSNPVAKIGVQGFQSNLIVKNLALKEVEKKAKKQEKEKHQRTEDALQFGQFATPPWSIIRPPLMMPVPMGPNRPRPPCYPMPPSDVRPRPYWLPPPPPGNQHPVYWSPRTTTGPYPYQSANRYMAPPPFGPFGLGPANNHPRMAWCPQPPHPMWANYRMPQP